MIGITAIKQIFFGNLTTNNNTVPKKELNNFSLLNKSIHDTFSFEGKRNYTKSQRKTMSALREAAVKLGLPDFYTGKRFSIKYMPTIEHMIPYSQKERAFEKGLNSVNSIENFIITGAKINNLRDSIPLKEWYRTHPDFIENGKNALKEYEKINTSRIDGKNWVKNIKKLLNSELGYIAFTGRKNQNNLNLIQKDQKLSYIA